MQLGFPWRQDHVSSVLTRRLYGNTAIDIDVREGSGEVELLLSADHASFGREQLAIRIRVGHPASCRLDGWRCPWNMRACTADGVFADAVEWALQRLDPQLLWQDEHVDLRCEAVRDACESVAARALEMADRSARQVVARIHDEARMFVYAALLEDNLDRVSELIDNCPGLLALAASLDLDNLPAQIRRGARIRDLIQDAVTRAGLRHPQAAALVRRAPREVSAQMIVDVSRVARADINDMPSTNEGRARWYEALAAWSRVLLRFSQLDLPRIGGFVSHHADELGATAKLRSPIDNMLGELCDWLTATSAPAPSRRSNPARIWAAIDAWHAQLWQRVLVDPAQALAQGPRATAHIPDVDAECIATAGDLYREGQLMRHCVGAMAHDAVSGEVHVYRATVAGQRVTIAIRRQGNGWRLVEAAGLANAPVARPDLVDRWMRRLRLQSCE